MRAGTGATAAARRARDPGNARIVRAGEQLAAPFGVAANLALIRVALLGAPQVEPAQGLLEFARGALVGRASGIAGLAHELCGFPFRLLQAGRYRAFRFEQCIQGRRIGGGHCLPLARSHHHSLPLVRALQRAFGRTW